MEWKNVIDIIWFAEAEQQETNLAKRWSLMKKDLNFLLEYILCSCKGWKGSRFSLGSFATSQLDADFLKYNRVEIYPVLETTN